MNLMWVYSVVHAIESSRAWGAFPKWQMQCNEVVRCDGPAHAVI